MYFRARLFFAARQCGVWTLRAGAPRHAGAHAGAPCYDGIDTPTRKEVSASTHNVDEMRQFRGADTLAYLSLEGMRQAVGVTQGRYFLGCYTTSYPTAVQEPLISLRSRE